MIKDKKLLMIGILLCCMIMVPLFNQGIMCGDELTTRFNAMNGFGFFLKSFMQEQLSKGRTLAIVVALPSYLGFLFSGNECFRVVQIISIFLDVFLFSYLVNKLLKDKYFSVFLGVFLVAFLPISFENTAPNAFCTLFNFPFAFLLLSYIFFLDYIDNKNISKMFISMILLFVSEMCYEAFIALTPIYLFILLYRMNIKQELKKIVVYLSIPFFTSCLYLVTYILCSKIYVSNYAGNQLGISDIKGTIAIIGHLFKAAIPGFFIWGSDKYRFLLKIFWNFTVAEVFRVGILVISFIYILFNLFGKRNLNKTEMIWKKHVGVIISGIICMILPSLPIAVSEMYQGAVGENGFVALPVTYFSYYFAVLVICYIVWFLLKDNWKMVVAAICICVILIGIQFSNGVFSQEQNRNFNRLEQMENCLKTDMFKWFGNTEFVSEDMFKTINSMAFYDSYWTQFSAYCGNGAIISNKEVSDKQNRIYYRDNKIYVWYNNELYIFTYDTIMGEDLVIVTDEKCSFQQYKNPIRDHGFNIYHFQNLN